MTGGTAGPTSSSRRAISRPTDYREKFEHKFRAALDRVAPEPRDAGGEATAGLRAGAGLGGITSSPNCAAIR